MDASIAWLARGERVAHYTASLPDDFHTRLKVWAVCARTTLQALMRAAARAADMDPTTARRR